jgi:magnesium chelatase family protein
MRTRFFETSFRQNADANLAQLRKYSHLSEEGEALLQSGVERYRLSARGYTRVLRLACTIADLAAQELITAEHIAEAFAFRKKDDV